MSEPKGPFDDAIRILHEAKGEAILVDEELVEVQLDAAIRVLEDWPKWKPLIEAAGKLNSGDRTWLRWVVTEGISSSERGRKDRFRTLLASLPDKE